MGPFGAGFSVPLEPEERVGVLAALVLILAVAGERAARAAPRQRRREQHALLVRVVDLRAGVLADGDEAIEEGAVRR